MQIKPVGTSKEPGFSADASVHHTIRMPHFRTLNWAVDDLMLQDFFYPISGVSSSGPEGGAIAWDFFKTNFAKVSIHDAKKGNFNFKLL